MKEEVHVLRDLGLRIRQIRRDKKLNQQIVSYTAEISEGYLRRIEKGKENPTMRTLIAIADALQVEVYDFFRIDNEEESTA